MIASEDSHGLGSLMNRVFQRTLGPCFLLLLAWSASAFAAEDPLTAYFTVPERPRFQPFQAPIEIVSVGVGSGGLIDLLALEYHGQPFPVARDPYNRKFHFGLWVNDPRDNSCYDTRAKVLIRDSRRPVVVRPNNHCSVLSGEWHEPYAGKALFSAAEVQIDHVVALKNAYTTGAHRWDFLHRCLYANFMGNDFQLLAVDGGENMRKGDKSPADWLPSDRRATCGHLLNWLRVKLIWGLVLGPREAAAISAEVRQAGCDPRAFRVPTDFVAQQRVLIQQNLNLCARLGPGGEDFDD